MSEFHRPNPEEAAEQKRSQEILASLGAELSVGLDMYLLEPGKGFSETEFVEKLVKLNPVYLEHIKNLAEEEVDKLKLANVEMEQEKEMAEFYAQNSKLKAELNKPASEAKSKISKEQLVDLAMIFIKKVEFFSQLEDRKQITVGDKTVAQLRDGVMGHRRMSVFVPGLFEVIENNESKEKNEIEQIDLVKVKVRYFFHDEKMRTFDEICQKARGFGLELCPPKVGPAYFLTSDNEPASEQLIMFAMDPISIHNFPFLFCLTRLSDGQNALLVDDAKRNYTSKTVFIFRLPAAKKEEPKTNPEPQKT